MKDDAISGSATIDAGWTVNDVIVNYPETVAIFNAFGVDSCCRGDATLDQAAAETGITEEALITALRTAVGNPGDSVRSDA